jgi:hypothetical protein
VSPNAEKQIFGDPLPAEILKNQAAEPFRKPSRKKHAFVSARFSESC